MQTVLALIVAVLIDWWARHLPGGHFIVQCRSINWFKSYVIKMMDFIKHYNITNNYLVTAALYLPLLAALFLLQLVFSKIFGPTGNVIFIIISLLYFLGSKEGIDQNSEFVQAHETSFGVMFWFAVLGPLGAFTYWFLAVCQQTGELNPAHNPSLYQTISWLHAIAAWIPARITGFVYALVGNFTKGFSCWLNAMRTPSLPSGAFLTDCGSAATDVSASDDGANLVDRAFVAWAILSVLIVALI